MNGNGVNGSRACPVCGGTETILHLDGGDSHFEPTAIGSSRQHVSAGRILRCRKCGFGFSEARSSENELADLYRRMDTRVYESELEGRERTARRHIAIVERYQKGGRILDVGCASGLFLSEAVRRGWEGTGVEPSEVLFTQAQERLAGRADLRCTILEQANLKGGFDALTLWDVLEHVPDPAGFLVECRNLLSPGGYLFLNVPDLGSLQARVLGSRWPLLLPEHLNYFTRGSLRLCGQRAGFTLARFGRRRVSFSLAYIAYRLSQHGLPGSGLLRSVTAGAMGKILIPVSMGETFAVWRRA